MEFKVGDKVIPVSKHYNIKWKSKENKLNTSIVWRYAQKIGQKFLYINNIFNEQGTIVCVCGYKLLDGGDFFLETDLRPIREEAFLEIFKEEIYGR